MIEMTGAERIVANFLTEKKLKYEFLPIVSVKDMKDMPKIKKLVKEIEKLNNILEETINTYLGE
jgi:cell fate regulator YaaT (PSP1 superfamily)